MRPSLDRWGYYTPPLLLCLPLETVDLSNILDRELEWRKSLERSQGQVVGTAVVDGKLLGEYDRLLLYFRLARLTPYFSSYFIID